MGNAIVTHICCVCVFEISISVYSGSVTPIPKLHSTTNALFYNESLSALRTIRNMTTPAELPTTKLWNRVISFTLVLFAKIVLPTRRLGGGALNRKTRTVVSCFQAQWVTDGDVHMGSVSLTCLNCSFCSFVRAWVCVCNMDISCIHYPLFL